MKTVIAILILFVCGFINCGPIDDGLLPSSGRRVSDERGSDSEPVDAIVVDVNEGRRPFYQYPRRRFMGPFFDEDEDQDQDDGFVNFRPPVYRPPLYRPFSFGFGYRPYANDYFANLRRQMEFLRRYFLSIYNNTDSGFGSPFDELPPNYDNSTYTTKVVNGSIISVNETVKKHTSNDSSFVFQIKVVQVRPQNETATPEEGVDKQEPEATEATGENQPEKLPENSSPLSPEITTTPAAAANATEQQTVPSDNEADNDVGVGRQFR